MDERRQEYKLLRILGASDNTLFANNLIYFASLGLLIGIMSLIGTIGLSHWFIHNILQNTFVLPYYIPAVIILSAVLLITLFSVLASRVKNQTKMSLCAETHF